MTRSLSFLRSIFILSHIFTIAACGGGGSSSPPDTTPDSFSFTAGNPVDPGEENVESPSATVQGIEEAVAISVSGGEYRIGAGGYTRTAGTVSNGQSVQVRVDASDEFSSDASVTLTIGGVSGTYTVTTVARDDTPEVFAPSAPTTNIPISTEVNFTEFTVAGLNDAVDIGIDIGTFTINAGSAVTSDSVSNDDRVVVTVPASGSFATTVDATLTVGSLTGVFSVVTEPRDIAPGEFSLVPVLDALAGAVITSDPITVEDVNDSVAITVSGGATYSIDSIEDGDFTSASDTINNDQLVRVRLTASLESLAVTESTLTLGSGDNSQSSTFSVRSALTFASSVDQPPGTTNVISDTVVAVAGFSRTQNIVVTDGEYSVDGGATYQASGVIENGQNLRVRANASVLYSSDVVTTVTITDPNDATTIVGTYTVTTLTDSTAPTAAILFPTPVSMTEGSTLTIRGTAEDDLSGVQSISVSVSSASGTMDPVEATSMGGSGFAEWSAEVTLGLGEVNTITVTTMDAEGNGLAEVTSVSVTQQTSVANFPNGVAPFNNLSPGGISLDQANSRLVIVDTSGIFTTDLNTGERAVLINNAALPSFPTKVHVDETAGQIYISSISGGHLVSANSDGSGVSVINESPSLLIEPYGMEISPFDGLLYVGDGGNGALISVDTGTEAANEEATFDDEFALFVPTGLAIVSATTVIVADEEVGSIVSIDVSGPSGIFRELAGGGEVVGPQDVEYDSDQSRVIFVDSGLDAVLSVPVAGGSVTTISDATNPNNTLVDPSGLALDAENNLAYVPSADLDGADILLDIVVVDLVSGDRVVLSRTIGEK